MLTCFCTVGEETVACEGQAAKLKKALAEPQGALWLDLEAPTDDEALLLAEVFRFHPTAIDPCLSPDVNMPLAMVFDDYLFLLIHGIDSKAATELLNTVEVGFFIGRNYLVTAHRGFSRSIEAARKACSDKSGPLTRGVDVMVKDILSRIMDNYRPVIQELEERLKRVHGQVLSREPPSSLLNDIRNIRHKSL